VKGLSQRSMAFGRTIIYNYTYLLNRKIKKRTKRKPSACVHSAWWDIITCSVHIINTPKKHQSDTE